MVLVLGQLWLRKFWGSLWQLTSHLRSSAAQIQNLRTGLLLAQCTYIQNKKPCKPCLGHFLRKKKNISSLRFSSFCQWSPPAGVVASASVGHHLGHLYGRVDAVFFFLKAYLILVLFQVCFFFFGGGDYILHVYICYFCLGSEANLSSKCGIGSLSGRNYWNSWTALLLHVSCIVFTALKQHQHQIERCATTKRYRHENCQVQKHALKTVAWESPKEIASK